MTKTKTNDSVDPTLKLLTELSERLSIIEADVKGLKAPKVSVAPQVSVTPVQDNSPHPVPSEYRKVVSETLNQAFGVRVEAMSDRPQFTLTIVVPKKYSTANADQLAAIGGEDIRPRVLDYALGLNGVKSWSEQVYKSFGPEIQAQIVADRNLSTVPTF